MLSKADKDALVAQITQFKDELREWGGDYLATEATWAEFIAWRTAVALEMQAEALWSEDEEDEPPKPPWER